MDLSRLLDKLRKIEMLHAGATTPGERGAAAAARDRILARLLTLKVEDPPVEYKFTFRDMWSRRIFLALLRRYELRPYRYRRQRYTTVQVKVSPRFVEETLWPEFEAFENTLRQYLEEVTERVAAEVLQADTSEAVVIDRQLSLPISSPPPTPATSPSTPATNPGSPPPPAATPEQKPPPQAATPEHRPLKGSTRRNKRKRKKGRGHRRR